jgi:hypothetical protein
MRSAVIPFALVLALLGCRREAPTVAQTPGADRARALRDVMRPDSRAALDATTVPLLFPNDLALAATAVVTSGPRWVAASIPQADLTVSIHATREAMPPPALNPPRHSDRLRALPATITVNEGIRAATWEEGGVAYMVDVECARPAEDPRCTADVFVRALVEGLVRVEAAR